MTDTNDMTVEIDAKLADWIADGTIVSEQRVEQFNERTIVVKNENGYSLFRAFPIGGEIAVSADKTDISADDMITALLAMTAA